MVSTTPIQTTATKHSNDMKFHLRRSPEHQWKNIYEIHPNKTYLKGT